MKSNQVEDEQALGLHILKWTWSLTNLYNWNGLKLVEVDDFSD